ncbi:MAG: S8 family serine peptidase [Solirubrobacteraceae bacterium]
MARITINGVSLDPIAHGRDLRSHSLESADASTSNYILVQTSGPLSKDERTQLTDLGVVIHEYVPEDTYLCGYEKSDLATIRELPFVTWADVYLQGFKIPPSLRPASPDASRSILPTTVERTPSRVPHEVDIVLHDDVDSSASEVKQQIATAAGLDPDDVEVGRRKVRLTVQRGRLGDLTALDTVRHVEPVPERRLHNNVARPIMNADVVVNGTQYRGAGQIVCVADTGFDEGSTTNVHPAFTGRVNNLYALGRPSPPKSNDPDGHGTHVAGSVLGDGTSSAMGGAIQGTAPDAELVLQSTLDSRGGLGGIPTDLTDLFVPPYDNDDVRVHTNSWGPTVAGLAYDSSAQELDQVVWDRPDLVICFSAGNSGTDGDGNGVIDAGQIGSQNAAKNCITIGASESERDFRPSYSDYWPGDFPAAPIADDQQANDAEGMVAFSSRGPTQESRIKPDVVAPGTCILSTRSRDATPGDTFGQSNDSDYYFSSGTSMATPLVAGCCAVLRETLVRNGLDRPPASLIKALLINGAVALPGQYSPSEAGPSPNNNSGWGRVDLAGSVILPGDEPNGGFGEGGPLEQGEEYGFTVDIPERRPQGRLGVAPAGIGVTFKITVVWSDPPGAALQNDLNLIVRASNGEERHGNMPAGSDGFDRENNVEQILWDAMPPGPADIVVRAERITQFAQPYAYAWRIS